MDSYEAAKAALVEVAEAKGYATTPPPKPRPKPVPRKLCPVGCCHPPSMKPVEVSKAGDFCRRHTGKVSHPLARQLGTARKHDRQVEAAKILEQAIIEARRNDDLWKPFAIEDRGRVEGCDSWREAVMRYFRIVGDGEDPVMISGKTGAVISIDEVRAYCPWVVVDGEDRVIAPRPEDGDKPAALSPLAWAIGRAHARCWRADAGLVWPTGEKPVVKNAWCGEELDYATATRIASRGHRS